ncbi:glycosyltransferase [Bacillus sp. AFS053548]|uniref:glycosyltransferase n=1 Tax=Bacillus sp. AFS053548 TaxID=2033505 RepID=UPI000BFE4332|nr:glycosyltransferase [Bacillus sp. AFS053548]PGM59107.1 glycosyl transferase [Bacillus sp. AFS053548]
MKIKILFMIINMNIGGTEKALLNMLSEMHEDKYEITVLMLEEFGGFLNELPSNIRIEYVKDYDKIKALLNNPPLLEAMEILKDAKPIRAINLIFHHLLSKIRKDRSSYFKYVLKDYRKFEKEYDIAVAYAGPMDLISYFVMHKINAKKKVQWIHFDVTKISFNNKFAINLYKKFDQIFVVSNEGKEKLIEKLSGIKNKINTFGNIISSSLIEKMAEREPGFDEDFKGIKILTVGRLSIEKGQDLAIKVLSKLKQAGYNVKWYCIGDGEGKAEYLKLINAYNVSEDFILLGTKTNPYPYMKQCDLYVQPSRHEGYCITLSEARCFNNPIVTTNFTGANEQLTNRETGLIVNFDEEEMYKAVKELLDNEILRNEIKINLQKESVDTTKEIEKLNLLYV